MTKDYPKVQESETVHDLSKHRKKRRQARYYFNMTYCDHIELSRYMNVPLGIARRWCLAFTKERQDRLRKK